MPISHTDHLFCSANVLYLKTKRKRRIITKFLWHQMRMITHKEDRRKFTHKYMKTDFGYVIFSDECRAMLHGPAGFSRGWFGMNQAAPIRIRRQHCCGGEMFYAALHGRNRVGPFRIDTVKCHIKWRFRNCQTIN